MDLSTHFCHMSILKKMTFFPPDPLLILSFGLKCNNTLRELTLRRNEAFTEIGWGSMFAVLESPNCRLEKLNLGLNRINDSLVCSLTNALRNNNTLKTLNLETILGEVTVNNTTWLVTIGWRNLFMGLLQSLNSTLERINLKCFGQGFDDSMIESLGHALANNSRLRELSLHTIRQITPVGWQNFDDVLRNPNLALEKLYLNYNSINDRIIVIFVEALANNNMLKVLNFVMRT